MGCRFLLLALLPICFSELARFVFESDTDTLDDHYDFGQAMGAKYAATIQKRLAAKADLKAMLNVYHNVPGGAELYAGFKTLHEKEFPDAMAELRGIASGANIPFEEIFIQNINEEFSFCSGKLHGSNVGPVAVDGCSDSMICQPSGTCAVAHNEDNNKEDLGATSLVTARFADRRFVAYTYLGGLPSGAFGFNDRNVAFTLNWMGPKDIVCPGVGRGFISRAVLSSTSFSDALAMITQTGQSAGHNFQLMDVSVPSIANVEVAERGLYSFRPIQEAYFHANQYTSLAISQILGNSSVHRVARAAALPTPTTITEMLALIGDQGDHEWPIFHDETSHKAGDLSDWTVQSVLFDLRASTMSVLEGNPKLKKVVAQVSLKNLTEVLM